MRLSIEINKTPLYIAVEKENIELIKLLFSYDDLDPNIPYIRSKIFNEIFSK